MVEGDDWLTTRQKQLLDLKLKKHNDNMVLHNALLETQKIAQEKLLVIEENKIEATKKISQRFIGALLVRS